MTNVIVSTCDIKEDYDIIGPVFFQISNKGLITQSVGDLKAKYQNKIEEIKKNVSITKNFADWSFLFGGDRISESSEIDIISFMVIEELKCRAARLSANAIIGFKRKITMDSSNSAIFIEVEGTAVRTKKNTNINDLSNEYIKYTATNDDLGLLATIVDIPKDGILTVPGFVSGMHVRTITTSEKLVKAKLKKLVIEGGVCEIKDYAFSKCYSLESIVLPENLQTVGAYAFEECSSLKAVYLPFGIKKIRAMAFADCPKLKLYISESYIPTDWSTRSWDESASILLKSSYSDFLKN